MSEDSLHQPNDKLFKATFSVPENARAFFQNHLPAELAGALEWDRIKLEPCSFIDPEFASSESDLLFRIQLEHCDAFLYLLFEHQSSEDPRMALRLLSYILRIWERFAKNHAPPAKLPAVLPIVLVQGKRPWKTSTRLEDLINLPPAHVLRPWQPTLMYHLLELVRLPYEALAGTPEGIITLRALKAQPMDELLGDALWDEPLLFSIPEDALERILRYILNADVNVSVLQERIEKIKTKPLQTKTMTLADQLIQQGRQEGEQRGRQKGLSEGELRAFRTAVLRALDIRHGGCPPGIREALESIQDPQQLERLLEVAFRSDSLEAFAEKL
jgi:predicted transposase/invertase (TIGR01784 family)